MRFLMALSFFPAFTIPLNAAYSDTLGKCLFSYCELRDYDNGLTSTVYLVDLSTGEVTLLCRLPNFKAFSAAAGPGWHEAVIHGSYLENGDAVLLLRFSVVGESPSCSVSDISGVAPGERGKTPYDRNETRKLVVARTSCGGAFVGSVDIWFSSGDRHYEELDLGAGVLDSIDYSKKSDAFVYFTQAGGDSERIFVNVRYPSGEMANSFPLPYEVKAVGALGANIKLLYVE